MATVLIAIDMSTPQHEIVHVSIHRFPTRMYQRVNQHRRAQVINRQLPKHPPNLKLLHWQVDAKKLTKYFAYDQYLKIMYESWQTDIPKHRRTKSQLNAGIDAVDPPMNLQEAFHSNITGHEDTTSISI